MKKTIILITGCQRSGTTLLHLILDSHPEISSINEKEFKFHHLNTYINAPWLPNNIAFKLPRYAPILQFIKGLPNRKVLWCIRDPVDVVYSMVNLRIQLQENLTIPWAAHPEAARAEILNCYWPLGIDQKNNLKELMSEYQKILSINILDWGKSEIIFSAALCWRIKNELALIYQSEGIGFHAVRYENVVMNTEDSAKEILDYIGVPWNDDVLRHHELHKGITSGGAVESRPVDENSLGLGKCYFTRNDIELISRICGDLPEKWGYYSLG